MGEEARERESYVLILPSYICWAVANSIILSYSFFTLHFSAGFFTLMYN